MNITIAMPLPGQNGDIARIYEQAEVAAERDLGFPSWSSARRTICLFGFRESALRAPIPPAERFIGKSVLYVAEYSRSYKNKTGAIQRRYTILAACTGMAMGIMVGGCLMIMNAGSHGGAE